MKKTAVSVGEAAVLEEKENPYIALKRQIEDYIEELFNKYDEDEVLVRRIDLILTDILIDRCLLWNTAHTITVDGDGNETCTEEYECLLTLLKRLLRVRQNWEEYHRY